MTMLDELAQVTQKLFHHRVSAWINERDCRNAQEVVNMVTVDPAKLGQILQEAKAALTQAEEADRKARAEAPGLMYEN